MKKVLKIFAGIIVGAVVLVAVVLVGGQLLVNSGLMKRLVDKAAAEYYEGDLSYSQIRASLLRHFPKLTVNLRDVSFTYPHDRFPEYDSTEVGRYFQNRGRAEEADTLASLGALSLDVNLMKFLSGVVRIDRVEMFAPAVYARAYEGGQANWKLLKFDMDQEEPEDTSGGIGNLRMSFGGMSISGNPHVLYVSQPDTVYATLRFSSLAASGFVRIRDGNLKVHGFRFSLDSLGVFGRLPSDTLAFTLDSLRIVQHRSQMFNIVADAKARLFTDAFGRMTVPISLLADVGYDIKDSRIGIDVPGLTASVAYVPIEVKGGATIDGAEKYVDASLRIEDCHLSKVLSEYAGSISPSVSDIRTNAVVDLSADVRGYIAADRLPEVEARIHIDPAYVRYVPKDFTGDVSMDVAASVAKSGKLGVRVNAMNVDIPGLSANVRGQVDDVLGDDPYFDVSGHLDSRIDTVMKYVPEISGIRASGDLSANVDVRMHLSEFDKYKFKDASITGRVEGKKLVVDMPSDSLYARLDNTGIDLSSGSEGLFVEMDIDSVAFRSGANLMARIRNMHNRAVISKEMVRDAMVPFISAEISDSSMFVKSGMNRVLARNMKVAAKASRRPVVTRRRIARQLPDTSAFHLPDFLSEKDFRRSDIRLDLGSKVDSLLARWTPSGAIFLERGSILTPRFPLRTRVDGIDATFDGNTILLDKAAVTSGTTDLSMSGKIGGLRGMLRGFGMLNLDIDILSHRININELVAAYNRGAEAEPVAESDESFVVDTLAQAELERESGRLLVLPANVVADIKARAEEVDYSKLTINGFATELTMKGRCLQMNNTSVSSGDSRILVDAFYSTKTKKDISLGLDIRMVDVTADKIVDLIPAVDSIFPLLQSFEGNLGCEVSAVTQLDTNMNVIFPSLKGVVRISGEDLLIRDAGDLKRITRLLMFRNKNIGKIQNMYVDAVVHDNELEIYPFILGVDRYELALAGLQNFDKSFKYHISLLKSPLIFKFGINLNGDFDKWKFSLGRPKYRAGVPVFTKQLDSMQFNIAQGIKNVYQQGVDNAMAEGLRSLDQLEKAKSKVGYRPDEDAGDLSLEEYLQIDSLVTSQELEDENRALEEEIDSCLDANFSAIESLTKEYEETVYDERLSGRLRKMKQK